MNALAEEKCECGKPVPYNRPNCECGRLFGFPNVRRALAMKADLQSHYEVAVKRAETEGLLAEVAILEGLLSTSIATITVSPKVLRNISFGQEYRTYYQAVDEGDRKIAMQAHHADRVAVDAKIHTGYGGHIVNAALSADGVGLTSYGPITVALKTTAIQDQASVLRENAFDFYARYALGTLGAQEEPGWRSNWEDRHQLGVAALAPQLKAGASSSDLCRLVLTSGAGRDQDRFMEVHIYGDLSFQSIQSVRLDQPLTDPQDVRDWTEATQKLERKDVSVLKGAMA